MQHAPMSRLKDVVDVRNNTDVLGGAGLPQSVSNELLASELARLQAQIARLCMTLEREVKCTAPGSAERGQVVRGIMRARSRRSEFFAADLFSDPAWDMLLDLYSAQLAQVKVAVTSLCIASNSPSSTALRWIGKLQNEGLVERRADPLDGRRVFLSLTDKGIDALDRYFASQLGLLVI